MCTEHGAVVLSTEPACDGVRSPPRLPKHQSGNPPGNRAGLVTGSTTYLPNEGTRTH